MKINKVISNTAYLQYMNVKRGLFKKTVGEVLYGKMIKFDINEPTQYGYIVRVGNISSGNCKVVGGCTDFNVACDMLLGELKIMKVITA